MAINAIFKLDDYISLNVGVGKEAGAPFVLGDLVGVLITGSGVDNTVANPTDAMNNGVGNQVGWASVALAGGFRVPVAAGTAYAVGDTVYITPAGAITKTASGNKPFGKVTHEPKPSTTGAGTVIVRIVQ